MSRAVFIQVVTGARQVGKTTLITQVAERSGLPYRYASADEPTLRGPEWIAQQWDAARLVAGDGGDDGALLILDEIQKAPNWSEAVKRLWDEDTRSRRRLKVVLSGSAQLLIGRGLTESLAGRFELLHVPHWSFLEMRTAFGWSLEQFLFYGAYPGAAPLVRQPARWSRYIRDSLIETTISRDVLLLSRVDKPALLRRLFELGCAYSGQILSYSEDAGPTPRRRQLHDAGPLSRSAGGRRNAEGIAEVRRIGSAAQEFQPQVASLQHRPDDRRIGPHPGPGTSRPRFLGSAGRVRGGGPSGECRRRRFVRGLLLARPPPRGGFRRACGTVGHGD